MKKTYLLLGFITVCFALFAVFSTHITFAKESFNDKDTNWSRDKVKRYIKKVFGEKEGKKAIAIFTSESGLNCTRMSKTNDIGVAQINKMHWKRFGGKDKLKSCKKNIDAAKTLYKEWGNSFKPWTNYRNGYYKKFL